ncbi:MAG TPA: LysR family transcriptional regulator [Bdellovibrionales bacterium]|nr:LysR family transcriptional regulator [Bdellovibrionales bacterium]
MKLNNLDLNKLNVFCSVVRHRGYRGASEELSLTRSAISQAVKSFEHSLGISLFERAGQRLLVTKEAQRFYDEVTRYQASLHESVRRLTDQPREPEGVLRIGSYLEFAKSQLVETIEEFLRTNKKVQLKLVFDAPSRLDRMLEAGLIDLSISIFPHRGLKSIVSEKLIQEELVLVGRRGLCSEKAKAAELKALPVIDYFQNHVLFKRWWRVHFDTRVQPHVRAFAATAEMVLQLVSSGLGVGVVPRYMYENASKKPELVLIQPTPRRLIDHIWLNRKGQDAPSPASDAFTRLLLNRLRS